MDVGFLFWSFDPKWNCSYRNRNRCAKVLATQAGKRRVLVFQLFDLRVDVFYGAWGYFCGHRDVRSLAWHSVGGRLALIACSYYWPSHIIKTEITIIVLDPSFQVGGH